MDHLLNEIDQKKKEISTDGYPMSIGELMSLYKDNELDVHPEFQRFFRWSIVQKSKLIESILLGIPIPSIFVSQRADGVWDVIDGQQRLSTIFEFLGVLKDENDKLKKPSKLVKTDYLPSLEDMMWDNSKDPKKSFSSTLKLSFKREKIDVKIVRKESDESIKFELFQRLNTLGSKLSDQEVRNCLLVMLDRSFYDWLKRLSEYESFLNSISLAERLIEEQYNVELVLRFFILKNIELREIKSTQDLGEFITQKMIQMVSSPDFDRPAEEKTFKRTFDIIDSSLESNAFKRFNTVKNKFEGSFLLSAFEAFAIAMGRNIDLWKGVNINSAKTRRNLEEKARSLWSNKEYQSRSGSGVNVARRVPAIIPVGQEIFRP